METGDPKQVAVLAVVAVGAVSFLVTRLGHKAGPPALAAHAARAAAAHSAVAFSLVRDPFSHPRLAPKPVKAEPEPTPTPASTKTSSFSLVGALPPADPEAAPLGPVRPVLAKEASAPKAAPPRPTGTTVGLEAIAGASDAVAFLSVGGAESRSFQAGERVVGAIRLLRVTDGEVVLSGPKGKLTLGVGERKTL